MTGSIAQEAERIVRRRARASRSLAVVFLAAQAGSFEPAPPKAIWITAWMVWLVLLLMFPILYGALVRGSRIRAILNDETTRDHRVRAMATGFWCAVATALLVYVLDLFEPVASSEAARLVVTFAVAAALLHFAALERTRWRNDDDDASDR